MKTFACSFVFVVVIFLSATSSMARNPNWRLGISGTSNLFNEIAYFGVIHHDYTIDKIGFQPGMYLQYDYNDRSTFVSGLQYFTVKYNVDYDYIFIDANDPSLPRLSNIKSEYLDIPLQYCFHFTVLS